jgi:hypothetical protein
LAKLAKGRVPMTSSPKKMNTRILLHDNTNYSTIVYFQQYYYCRNGFVSQQPSSSVTPLENPKSRS